MFKLYNKKKYKTACEPVKGFMSKKEFKKLTLNGRKSKLPSISYDAVNLTINSQCLNNNIILGGGGSGLNNLLKLEVIGAGECKNDNPVYVVMTTCTKSFEKWYNHLEQHGYKIYNYRYWEEGYQIKNNLNYNPFEWFENLYNIEQYASIICSYLNTEDTFIRKAAFYLLCSVISYVNQSESRNMLEVSKWLNNFDKYIEVIKEEDGYSYKSLQIFINAAGIAQKEILIKLSEAVSFTVYSISQPNKLTSDNFNDSILEEESIIFIDKAVDFNEWLSTGILASIMSKLSAEGHTNKRHVKFIYDISDAFLVEPINGLEQMLRIGRMHNFSIDLYTHGLELYVKSNKITLLELIISLRCFIFLGTKNKEDLALTEIIMKELYPELDIKLKLEDMSFEQYIVQIRGIKPILINKGHPIF